MTLNHREKDLSRLKGSRIHVAVTFAGLKTTWYAYVLFDNSQKLVRLTGDQLLILVQGYCMVQNSLTSVTSNMGAHVLTWNRKQA